MADEEKKEETTKEVAKFEQQIPLKNGLPAPTTLEQMFRVAKMLAHSQMVPEAYQITLPKGFESWADVPTDKIKQAVNLATQKIVAATIMGNELGLSMFSALRSIAVINGRPSVWGDAVPALGQRAVTVEDIKETYAGSIKDKTRTAYCKIKLKGRASWIEREFSVEDAVRADLWDNSKRPTWKKYPDVMLMNRARGLAWRAAAPGALMGLPTSDEAMDMDPVSDVPDAEIIPPTAGDLGDDDVPADHVARQETEEAGSGPPTEEEETIEPEVVDTTTPPEEILSFITDQCGDDPDASQKMMEKFDAFVNDLCKWYDASRADVFDQMIKDGLEQAWDKFMGWINEQAKKKHQDLQKDIDDAGAGKKENIWAQGGWKRQGGEKFKTYLLNHLKELYEMPDDFIRQMENRWNDFKLGEFPSKAELDGDEK